MNTARADKMPLWLRAPRRSWEDRGKSSTFRGEGIIFIFGLMRSGTSWLGKIFDSHPDVLYRHEPDLFLIDEQLPQYDDEGRENRDLDDMREYIERLAQCASSHAAGPPPYFPKLYRGPLLRLLRIGILFAVRKLEGMPGGARWRRRIAIPEFVGRRAHPPRRLVIKSISSLDRARLFAEAWPQSRSIAILRHPCGQVGSMARGIALGKIPDPGPPIELARSRRAARMGLNVDAVDELSPIEQLAWRWAFWSQLALDEFGDLSGAKIICYEDLAADPQRIAQELFAFVGLSWHPQTAAFLEASTGRDESNRYFGVTRDSTAAANRWQQEVSARDQKRILDIARQVPVGEVFAS